ncbi:hypothetical protein ACHAXA_011298, partial [Cyclostephanos tholiformis]
QTFGCDTNLPVIKGEAYGSEPFDENEGGVGLAKRSAIKVIGVSSKGKGSDAKELVRYDKLQELDISVAKSTMDKANCKLLCCGTGKETYQDPGKSYRVEEKVIKLAPVEAAKNALSSMDSSPTIGSEGGSVVINFLGGDELIIGEVLDACGLTGVDRSIASGEVYIQDEKWFGVSEEDIITA